LKIALWSPGAGRGWVAALEPHLGREAELDVVGEEPRSPPAADLHIYHVGDDPAHGFVYRALLRQPGLVVLEEWGLHRLVHAETVGRGNEAEYRKEARRAHGELGDFVSRQVVEGSGGSLPGAVLTMNERVLEAGLGFVATSEVVQARVAARLPGRAVAHLPLAFQAPPTLAGREGARAALRVSPGGLLVVALQPAAADTPPERVARALGEVREAEPRAVVRWTREDDPALVSRLAAADVVVALEHPPRAGLGVAVPLAVAEGTCALVSAGSGAAREMPEGVVARVSPGPTEIDETVALVGRLLADEALRTRMGGLARAHAARRRDPEGAARALLDLVRAVEPARGGAGQTLAPPRGVAGRLASRALDEIVVAARELGVVDPPPGLALLAAHLFGEEGP
jgi:glycosyltransferase involved in cell wall biosynthesis